MSEAKLVEVTDKQNTFTYNRGMRGRGMSNFILTPEEIDKVRPTLQKLNTAADMIRYLYDMGWSNAAICKVVVYPTDTMYHKAGDQLLPQHVATTISKYRVEKDANPQISPIRNAPWVLLPRNEGLLIDANPERQTSEEIAKEEPSEEQLEKEAKAEEEEGEIKHLVNPSLEEIQKEMAEKQAAAANYKSS